MKELAALISEWPYVTWALGVAAIFYGITKFVTKDLHPDKQAALSLFLKGDYESTWITQFGTQFDHLFGEKHLRPRCFLLSAGASVAAVFALWLLFDQILGLISVRAGTELPLVQALLVGAAINIVPDFLSLWETRWLLKVFERVRNPFAQLLVLALDAVITGAIIYAGIQAYLWVTGQELISLVEMMALFSIYAVFFYSTFLTSIWAWAYCLTSWFARFSGSLKTWFDVDNSPGSVLARLGAIVIFLACLLVKPAFTLDKDGQIPFDTALCDAFPASACQHVARLTNNEQEKLVYLGKACIGGATEECMDTAFKLYEVQPEQAVKLWDKACDSGDFMGCANLGSLYQYALGVEQDYGRAKELYQKACDGGEEVGCRYLGYLYEESLGVEQDYGQAKELYRKACDGGEALGCANLGYLYAKALGVERDYGRAKDLYQKACDGGEALGCANLGYMYVEALGVEQDYRRAKDLYQKVCNGGEAAGCRNLGLLYHQALGVEQDYGRAKELYQKACDGGIALSCTDLGYLYRNALGVEQDYGKAKDLYQKACDGGNALGCTNLGYLYDEALGVEQDYGRSKDLYQKACDGGNALGCNNLGYLYRNALGVEQDYGRAKDLYQKACDDGEAIGCSNLGELYRDALGVEQDYGRAKDLFQKACDGGNALGCYKLAEMTSQKPIAKTSDTNSRE